MKPRTSGFALLSIVALFAAATDSRASTVFPMTFEQAAAQSDVVVLGKVVEVPELGNRVKIAQYFKGSGADVISVDAPRLPPVGSEVVLFLRTWGDGFALSSASHGVIPVEKGKGGSRTVTFLFRETSLMPKDALASFRRFHPEAVTTADEPVPGVLAVEELGDLFERLARLGS